MKRLLALFLAVLLLLCACGEVTPPDTTPTDTTESDVGGAVTDDSESETQGSDEKDPVVREDFVISVLDDTYVMNGSQTADTSSQSFSAEGRLHAKNLSGNKLRRYIYLKFDLSALTGDEDFSSIELSLTLAARQHDAGNPEQMALNVYGCDSGWTGDALTFASQPAHYSLVASRTDIDATETTYTFPVTDYVRKALAVGQEYVAFYIEEATPETAMHMQFYSKEGDAQKAPTLSVSYTKTDDNVYGGEEMVQLPDGLNVLLGETAPGTAVHIAASEDTYVSVGEAAANDSLNKNFGSSDILDFKAKTGKGTQLYRIALLKFDISAYSDMKVGKVVLRLDCVENEVNTGTVVNVYACDPSWSESTVTFNTKPERGQLVGSTDTAFKGIVLIDVTDYVFDLLYDGVKEVSFYLEGDSGNARRLKFASKESTKGTAPTLVLNSMGDAAYTTALNYSGLDPWGYAMKLYNTWTERWANIQKNIGRTDAEVITDKSSEYNLTVGAALAGQTNGASTSYTNRKTRSLLSLTGYRYNNDEAALYDQYGGYLGGRAFDDTGYFRTEFVDGRWWVIDPEGNPFYRTAVVSIGTGSKNQKNIILSRHGSLESWAEATTDRLRDLGFNSAGGWSSLDTLIDVDQPLTQTKILNVLSGYAKTLGLNNSTSGSTSFLGGNLAVFDPAFASYCDTTIKTQVTPYATSPYVFGWMSDNELPDSIGTLDNYLNLDPTDATSAYSYAMGWTFMYMKTGNKNVSVTDVTDELRREFRAMVYDRYFECVTTALDKYDPNHMYMGCRFLKGCYADEYVMKVAGNWCDIITFNYYSTWTPDSNLIANIQNWAETPFVVTEWYAKGMDVWEADNRMTNESGGGWTVKNQADRGKFYQNFALKLLECKYCVGFDWFKYLDNDPDDLTADLSNRNANKGIYSNAYQEYTDLTDLMREINLNKYSLIEFFDAR